jgi:hypothetical protein
MAIDYKKLSATALRLIKDNGRTLSLVQFQQTGTDIQQPWKGAYPNPIGNQLDRSGVVVYSSSLLGSKAVNDDMLKRVTDVAIVACDGFSLKNYDAVIDNGIQYSIQWAQELTPGPIDTPLIAYIGFNR